MNFFVYNIFYYIPFHAISVDFVYRITGAVGVGIDGWEFSGFWVGALEDAEGGQLHASLEVVVAQRQVGTKLLAAVFERIDFLSVRRCLRQAVGIIVGLLDYSCAVLVIHSADITLIVFDVDVGLQFLVKVAPRQCHAVELWRADRSASGKAERPDVASGCPLLYGST